MFVNTEEGSGLILKVTKNSNYPPYGRGLTSYECSIITFAKDVMSGIKCLISELTDSKAQHPKYKT